jgi:hypothetical protein
MNAKVLIGALTGKGYIGIVKQYIDKVFKHESKKFDHREPEIDVILRKYPDGNIRIFTYSTRDKKLLRELEDTEAEKILTS